MLPDFKKFQYGQKPIYRTLVLGALITALVVFSVTIFTASHLASKSFQQQVVKDTHTLSELTFQNMYQIMSKGWSRDQLLDFRQRLQQTYEQKGLTYSIYRTQLVSEQFGYLDSMISSTAEPYIKRVLEGEDLQVYEKGHQVGFLKPLTANTSCLVCHQNSQEGDILGVMAVEQDVSQVLEPIEQEFLFWMLALLPIPILLALLIGRRLSGSLMKSVDDLNTRIQSIHHVDDLQQLSEGKAVFEYAEFNKLNQSLDQLSNQIKQIAIDRDILDFEIQLLDKLVLSQEIIKDWKHHICLLMDEINKILPLYTLFVVFRTDDSDQYVIEIFWLGRPSEEIHKRAEEDAKATLKSVAFFNEDTVFTVNHTYAHLDTLEIKDQIQTQSKSLVLDRPKIGGVVGLGVETLPPKDSSRSIVVESILTTLVNVIGSIKAINKFTKELEYYATRDPLTHLFNQRVFHEMLAYEVSRAHRHGYEFALLMLDFDNFKLINDQYGHAFGDEVLKSFATTISNVLDEGDIFCRYGGDEFCIVLPESNLASSEQVARQILEATHQLKLEEPNGHKVSISCSVGVAVYPQHADNKEDLFMVADNMLYRVKDSGKKSFAVPNEADLVSVYKENNDLSLFIIEAVKSGEGIEPHFQPIVNMNNGEIQVHELLMRLRQDNELVSAARFIETAEHMGLVNQMDLILIDKAFKQIQDTGYTGILFINLSPKAIVASSFIQHILSLTENYQLDHKRIVFEITERETVHNISLLEKFVSELRAQDFRFAIDDFGSGFSSFQYLKRFPVDFIKIEGEFVNNMSRNKIDYAFVQSAVSMAETLGIQTIAEFIENDETLQIVKDLGIDYAQGYLLSPPRSQFQPNLAAHAEASMKKVLSKS